jgi:uncharacterized membrane protein (DUF4010 family)
MDDVLTVPAALALALGLGFFLGLAFEEHYAEDQVRRPGGIRTFPMLALTGGVLWLIEPAHGTAFLVLLGFVAVAMLLYWRAWMALQQAGEPRPRGGLLVAVVNLAAAAIGPACLTQPPWIPVGLTMAAVLLLRARISLHGLAARVPGREITTAAQFLVLAGVVLPLVPHAPIAAWLPLTPFQIWLAVVAMSGISWGTYLLQRYVSPGHGPLIGAAVGGLYSSTAATVALARVLRDAPGRQPVVEAAIVLATAVMYLRVVLIAGVFDTGFALALAPWLVGLGAAAAAAAAVLLRDGRGLKPELPNPSANPLRIGTALAFAVLFIAVSAATAWLGDAFGTAGLYAVAAIVGLGDLDAITVGLATAPVQGGVGAILVATASNNTVKGSLALGFGGGRRAWRPAGTLYAVSAATWAVIALAL